MQKLLQISWNLGWDFSIKHDVGQGSLSQYLKLFIFFFPPWCSLRLCFQTHDSRLAHQVPGQVMIWQVSKHILLIYCLHQLPLQVDIDSFEPWLPVSIGLLLQGSELHPPPSGSLAVLPNVLQLHNHLLILKLLIPLLQVLYSPLGSIQVGG